MPWATPTLKQVRISTRDYVLTQLGARAMIPNSVLRIMSDTMAGLAHLVLLYIDWLAKQLLPDTAEVEWLDRHGHIWLVNADGSTGRKAAAFAHGSVLFNGTIGVVVPSGTLLNADPTLQYQTTSTALIGTSGGEATAVALSPGTASNLPSGQPLNLMVEISGVDSAVLSGDMTGGTEVETDDELRARVLRRIQQPPMGGAAHDYEAWALAVPGVTRAWCAPLEMGIGTVTVRVLCDDLRAADDGWPTEADLAVVNGYLDTVRPVAVKDFWALAPIKQTIDVSIAMLNPDTPTTREAVEQSIDSMLLQLAKPGQTIYAAWKANAVMDAAGVISFELTNWADDVMASPGHMAVLGDITYD